MHYIYCPSILQKAWLVSPFIECPGIIHDDKLVSHFTECLGVLYRMRHSTHCLITYTYVHFRMKSVLHICIYACMYYVCMHACMYSGGVGYTHVQV